MLNINYDNSVVQFTPIRRRRERVKREMAVKSEPARRIPPPVAQHEARPGRSPARPFILQPGFSYRRVNRALAAPGLVSGSPLCPLELPQSRGVAKATGRRNGENSPPVSRSRIGTDLVKPKRGRAWISPVRRTFHLLSSCRSGTWMRTPQPRAAASTRPSRAELAPTATSESAAVGTTSNTAEYDGY